MAQGKVIVGSTQFAADENGYKIDGGTTVKNVLEFSISVALGWVEIVLGSTDTCKSILVTSRDGANFQLSHLSAGTRYSTIPGVMSMNIAKASSRTLFYVKGTSTTTLEVILLD